jgi:hypothetical protein
VEDLRPNSMFLNNQYFMKKTLLFSIAITCFLQTKAQHNQAKNVNIHSIIVDSIIQTTNYTYLLGKEKNVSSWLAVPTVNAEVGKTYYYMGGMPMNNFSSKELKRTFDVVIFLGEISEVPLDEHGVAKTDPHAASDKPYKRVAPKENKLDVKIEPIADGISIKELFSNKEKYAGKTVKIKASVTKFNEEIMNKNWAHIQDGTDFEGKFDLVVTTQSKVKVGDVVVFEGKVTLNKDFGYGYNFDLLVEDAVAK